jgi:K(+)-stimulated pyrophosphate-energized sodium pump
MAADLFESYAVTLVAALILGRAAWGSDGLVFPLIVGGVGVLVAIFGVFITRLRAADRSGMTAINRAFYISAALSAVLVTIVSFLYLPDTFAGFGEPYAATPGNPRWIAIGAGCAARQSERGARLRVVASGAPRGSQTLAAAGATERTVLE